MKTAKIFKHGNSKAVRLPKEFRFAGHEVRIKHVGAAVLLLPKQIACERVIAVLERLKGAFERRQLKS